MSFEVQVEAAKLSVPSQLAALVVPDAAMERVARTGRLRWPLIAAMVCALFAGGTSALRVDARDATLRELEKHDQLKSMSDKQLEDAEQGEARSFVVKRVAWAVVEAPLTLVLDALALFALSWFLRGRLQAPALFAVCGVALLPFALGNVLEGAAALRLASIPPEMFHHLVPHDLAEFAAAVGAPLQGPLARLASAVDLFSLWSAVVLGFGLASAAALPLRRALPAALLGWLLWRLLTHVALAHGG